MLSFFEESFTAECQPEEDGFTGRLRSINKWTDEILDKKIEIM